MQSKKLIEVALPLDAINKASAREKSIRHGHPSTLHLWWARRPLAAARAVIFAQMIDDPASHPEEFPTEEDQESERQRLFGIIEELVKWENTTNETLLQQARDEIWKSWRTTCLANAKHPRAKDIFDPSRLPAFHDPFAGGGALPLEAQRVGLEAKASDLNPVAVLINKAMIEIPPKFAGNSPVNRKVQSQGVLVGKQWFGGQGLAEDVRHYGKWLRDEADRRIGDLYPEVEVSKELAETRDDLKPYAGKRLKVIAWIWARTVVSPNPAFSSVHVPLASTFLLSTKKGQEAYVEPIIDSEGYSFSVRVGKPNDEKTVSAGTKLSRGANFRCVMSGTPISPEHIKSEGMAGRMGARLMAVVAEGTKRRVYLAPTSEMEAVAQEAVPEWKPDIVISGSTQYLGVKPYGMETFDQLFTKRQLIALTTFSDLALEVRTRVLDDAIASGLDKDDGSLVLGGVGAAAYADAIATYLAFAVSKALDRNTSLCTWEHRMNRMGHTFTRQALPMTWDYVETNPLAGAGGDIYGTAHSLAEVLDKMLSSLPGNADQQDAATQSKSIDCVISTDPPYYDNVPYADLSDFFYIWLRRSLRTIFPSLFATVSVPKSDELVAFAHRHANKVSAEKFFLDGMTKAMNCIADQAHPAFPVTIYYAFKQTETRSDEGTSSTGWETFLDAVIQAGFSITGTWPMRTELTNRMRGMGSNALASSIVLVCRKRLDVGHTATRREFVSALKEELPVAVAHLQHGNIAPVDLAQASIGPGMAIYTRYEKVLDAEGKQLSVKAALVLINETLDESLAEQEGDFDADSRWAVTWFEENGFAAGEAGSANLLANAKNTSVAGLQKAGILQSKGSRVRLLRPEELPGDWDPLKDERLTVWEVVHHLVRLLENDGELAAANLVSKLAHKAEVAREMAYRLYTLSERKKRPKEAMSYNGLVQSWPEILRLARESGKPPGPKQGELI